MSAQKRDVDDDDLKDYILGTIDRLERLAKRLEVIAEEQKDDDDPNRAESA